MNTIQIESGIKIPLSKWEEAKYPFAQLKVGDSFWCDTKRVRSAATQWSRRYPAFKFVTRAETKDGVTGVRVWRVSVEGE